MPPGPKGGVMTHVTPPLGSATGLEHMKYLTSFPGACVYVYPLMCDTIFHKTNTTGTIGFGIAHVLRKRDWEACSALGGALRCGKCARALVVIQNQILTIFPSPPIRAPLFSPLSDHACSVNTHKVVLLVQTLILMQGMYR